MDHLITQAVTRRSSPAAQLRTRPVDEFTVKQAGSSPAEIGSEHALEHGRRPVVRRGANRDKTKDEMPAVTPRAKTVCGENENDCELRKTQDQESARRIQRAEGGRPRGHDGDARPPTFAVGTSRDALPRPLPNHARHPRFRLSGCRIPKV